MNQFSLFEISWEVAHRVGGIHTVVATKARSSVERYGDDLVIVGPWLLDQHDPDAVLDPTPGYEEFEESCRAMGVPVRVGRWRVPGRPLTILVEFSGLYTQKDAVLADLWTRHRVDSLAGDWGYVEPVLFGHAAGMVIERYWRDVVRGQRSVGVAQAHEWMTGSALLYLNSNVPEIGTVFTAHATVIGRAAATEGRVGESVLGDLSAEQTAATLAVRARHSMEKTAATVADVFTAVSAIASDEAERFFGRGAAPVLANGLDPEVLAERLGGVSRSQARDGLRNLALRFLGADVGDAAILCAGSRYEFHNKGLDVLLDAAAALAEQPGRPLILFLLVPAGNSGLKRGVTSRLAAETPERGEPIGIALHNLFDPDDDPIAVRCRELGLDNAHGSRVKVIHWAEYVGPDDGILGMRYEAVVQGADATCFPSFYESWGYTPQESLALGVPTVTTDLAGFGRWAQAAGFDADSGVHVLAREGRTQDAVVVDLTAVLARLVDEEAPAEDACREVAAATYWPCLFEAYERAYEAARSMAAARDGGTHQPARPLRLPVRGAATNGIPHVFALDVPTIVPGSLAGLTALAANWAWAWDVDAPALFGEICAETWDRVRHSPVRLLREVAHSRLEERAGDAAYVARVAAAAERVSTYLAAPLDERDVTAAHPVAYFCAEFGVHESFPIYSGGLGVLAGDHLRAASDLGVPLVAVGLLYRAGYMRQVLRGGVQQEALPERVDPRDLPLARVVDEDGQPIEIKLRMPGSEPVLHVWRTDVGRVPLYLLDSDVPGNREEDREITRALYAGDQETRIRQEIVLGIGGVRALSRLAIEPSVVHINEGHGAFAALERVGRLVHKTGLTFDQAREAVRATTVFTTHTPVPAGHDEFPEDLVRRYFGNAAHWAGVPWEQFMALGSSTAAPSRFNMTGLAVRFASRVNGVSVKHADVSRELLHRFCPQLLEEETPVVPITNGIHTGFWTRPIVQQTLGVEPGPLLDSDFARAADLDDTSIWSMRRTLRDEMIHELTLHLRRSFARQGDSPSLLASIESQLTPDALYIGFARRFATYKRAGLVFGERERLRALLSSSERPVRLLIAGKAHPRDTDAQELIATIGRLAREPEFAGRVVLIENYDVDVARWLVAGVDIWLNNPRPPLEASGTSGMKASANGALNLSVGDGWWLEGFDGTNGWRIGADELFAAPELQDAHDAESLFGLLEHEIVPMFFDRDEDGVSSRWIECVRRALVTVPQQFSAGRMVTDYREWAYEPLARRYGEIGADEYGAAADAFDDLLRVRRALRSVRITDATVDDVASVQPGTELAIDVDVDLGELAADDVAVEAVLGRRDEDGGLRDLTTVRLSAQSRDADERARFSGTVPVRFSGALGYAVRVRPARADGPAYDDPVVWA